MKERSSFSPVDAQCVTPAVEDQVIGKETQAEGVENLLVEQFALKRKAVRTRRASIERAFARPTTGERLVKVRRGRRRRTTSAG